MRGEEPVSVRFRSSLGPEVLIFCLLTAGVPVFVSVFFSREDLALSAALSALALGIVGALFFTTSYEITERELLIRIGFFRRSIFLKDIVRAERRRGVDRCGCTWDTDRVYIDYAGEGWAKRTAVSPRDKERFLQVLRRP